MFVTKIQWHNASEELPDESCDVVVACEDEGVIYHISNVYFSAYHKMFNCYDCCECPDIKIDSVKYWAYFDEFAKALSKNN